MLGADLLLQAGAAPALIDELRDVTSSALAENTRRAAGAAVLVGLMDRAWRSPSALTEPWYESAFVETTVDHAIAHLPGTWLDDITAVTARGGPLLTGLSGPAIPGPTFSGSRAVGGADADLVIGTTVIEIKAIRTATLRLRDAQQLVAYALLDFDDDYSLTHAAVVSARYGQVVTWSLSEVLDQAGGLALHDARSLLKSAVGVA